MLLVSLLNIVQEKNLIIMIWVMCVILELNTCSLPCRTGWFIVIFELKYVLLFFIGAHALFPDENRQGDSKIESWLNEKVNVLPQ